MVIPSVIQTVELFCFSFVVILMFLLLHSTTFFRWTILFLVCSVSRLFRICQPHPVVRLQF